MKDIVQNKGGKVLSAAFFTVEICFSCRTLF